MNKKMRHIDFLETPIHPNFLRFKGKKDYCFPIWDLPNKEIHMLFERVAKEVIQEKRDKSIKIAPKESQVCGPTTR